MASSPSMFGDGPAAQADLTPNDYIQPNLGHGLRIWWAFFWRNTLIAVVLGFQLGAAIQWLGDKGLVSDRMRPLVLQFGTGAIGYIPAIFVMYYIFRKSFHDFRIRLTSISDPAQTLPFTPRRILRIWWTYTWRTAVYTIVLGVAMSVPMGFLMGAASVISPVFGRVFSAIESVVVAGAIGLFVIYSNILDEEISDFCVGLAPTTPPVRRSTFEVGSSAHEAGRAPSEQ